MAKKGKLPPGQGPARKRRPADAKPGVGGELPTRKQVLEFIKGSEQKVGKREIARAFGIGGGGRIALKRLLAEMAHDGSLSGNRREMRPKGGLPPVAVLDITGRDREGDLYGIPIVWEEPDEERPRVLLVDGKPKGAHEAEVGIGDRVLARITTLETADVAGYRFEAHVLKRLPKEKRRLLGIFRADTTREKARGTFVKAGGGTIEPIDRKELRSWRIAPGDEASAKDGDLVRFDLAAKGRTHSPQARILESLGNPDDQRQISLIAVHAYGIPDDFPEGVIAETQALTQAQLGSRTDLRQVPLLTIDPVDARDHDDAVFAEDDPDPANPGGFRVLVAIADVAHYVRPGSRLDREAQLRGNSVYFPDRVVPMLPERISNDLCSLRELEDRPCLAVRMTFDRDGEKRGHSFMRAMMRSAAKLSYQEAQAAIDGAPTEKCLPLMETALRPLWRAYAALSKARDAREPLDLDLPERKIKLDKDGRVADVLIPERLAAHRLIEEFMIQANVAAAETLEQKKGAVVYRVHDAPSQEKLKALREFLETIDLKLPPAGDLRPGAFNKILAKAKEMPVPELVNEVVLRSQAQAIYDTGNIGHFGLNLRRYAHFTSPIRRYADLLVHRGLIAALGAGDDGMPDDARSGLKPIAQQISEAERRAMMAERETIDRLIAAHLADRVGAKFAARIGGVTRSGLFVRLKDTGADGFVPISSLGDEYFQHVEAAHALVGARSGGAYRLGDAVEVRLVEAIPSAGALRFEMITPPAQGALGSVKGLRMSRLPGHRGAGRQGRRPGPPRRR